MQLPQIINSLLENDMYKFSMGQCIYHQFSAYKLPGPSNAGIQMYFSHLKW